MDSIVKVGKTPARQRWQGSINRTLTSAQVQDVETALQELKFQLMAEGTSGSEAIDSALTEKINGKTIRQIIGLGLTAKLERLAQQRASIEVVLMRNSELVTRGGDEASAAYLARKRDEQVSRRDAVDREIAGVRERMKAEGLTPPADGAGEPDAAPQLIRK